MNTWKINQCQRRLTKRGIYIAHPNSHIRRHDLTLEFPVLGIRNYECEYCTITPIYSLDLKIHMDAAFQSHVGPPHVGTYVLFREMRITLEHDYAHLNCSKH